MCTDFKCTGTRNQEKQTETPRLLRQTQTFLCQCTRNANCERMKGTWGHKGTFVCIRKHPISFFLCVCICLIFVQGQRERFQIFLCVCMHEWRQARCGHTNTQRGQRSQYDIPHNSGHTHILDLCFCPWTCSKNRLNYVNIHIAMYAVLLSVITPSR